MSPLRQTETSALSQASLEELVREMISRLGYDPALEGLEETPRRVAKSLEFLTHGHSLDPAEVVNGALFSVEYDEMVIVKDIEMFSLLQVQERLTTQLAEAIQTIIQPQGVGVVVDARHLCMMMRGVEKQHSAAVTSSMLGAFRQQETRNEFLSLLRQKTASGF